MQRSTPSPPSATRSAALCALVLLGAACDDGGASAPEPDAVSVDGAVADQGVDARLELDAAPDAVTPDLGDPDGAGDAALDLGSDADAEWIEPDPAWLQPEPAAFQVGAAVRRMPVAVGFPTSGNGPGGARSRTPFANVYPGTTRVHSHPDIRVVVFAAGDQRLILVRTDTIGISGQIRRAIIAELAPRYGDAIDHQLVISGTHTHSGPGRLIDKPYWNIIQDDFFPEFFLNVRDTIVEAIDAAVADLRPARVGHGVALAPDVNKERRCESDDFDEPEMPFIRVDDPDGQTRAVVVFHAVHGTLIGQGDLMLSQDVSGGIEAKVAESFDHPVTVMFMNGAAANKGVGSPQRPRDPTAPEWDGDLLRIESVGMSAAAAIRAAWDQVEMQAEGVLHSRTVRPPINRELLGYTQAEFRYEYGAVYCGASSDTRCEGEPYDNLTRACVPFPTPESAAPMHTAVTVGRIGSRFFLTAPGEFSTELARRARAAAIELTGLSDAVVMGYAQEYLGYSLSEADWWRGGYEASGGLWGPRQGDFLTASIISAVRAYGNPRVPLAFEDQPLEPIPGPWDFEPWPVEPSVAAPALLADVPAEVPSDAVLRMTFAGGDPWLGTPVVRLEREAEDGWAPALGPNGVPIDSDGYLMVLELTPSPGYEAEPEAPAREFAWTVELPASRAFGGGPDLSAGRFRLVATGRAQVAGAEVADYTLASAPFTVTAL